MFGGGGSSADASKDEDAAAGDDDGGEEGAAYKPIVKLPPAQAQKTGEEDETIKFEMRAKLYRFGEGNAGAQWKERGTGQVKLLMHKETHRCRLLMRREQVLKICCNLPVQPDIKMQMMGERAVKWISPDPSDEDGEPRILAGILRR